MSGHNTLGDNHAQSGAELHFRVLLWIEGNVAGAPLHVAASRTASHFEVSRSTAYRWLSAYRAAKGVA
jgi:hypothetical protein